MDNNHDSKNKFLKSDFIWYMSSEDWKIYKELWPKQLRYNILQQHLSTLDSYYINYYSSLDFKSIDYEALKKIYFN